MLELYAENNKHVYLFQENARNDPNAHVFSQSSVYSYTNTGGEGSRPRVYQATSSVRQAPGGVSHFNIYMYIPQYHDNFILVYVI
jgi:hypothetical protein